MIEKNNALNIDYLRNKVKNDGASIHTFGLGFVQLKINENERIHFWKSSLLQNTPEETLHDHRYTFTSTILLGSLIHEIYDFEKTNENDYTHTMSTVLCQRGNSQEPIFFGYGKLKFLGRYDMAEGSTYIMPNYLFHKTIGVNDGCVTHLLRDNIQSDVAKILTEKDKNNNVCPFEVDLTEDQCWDIVNEVINIKKDKVENPGYHLKKIPKGKFGDPSKILEETLEFIDAVEQNANIMCLVELSDLYGAIEGYLKKENSNINMADLEKMSKITQRAFNTGLRK